MTDEKIEVGRIIERLVEHSGDLNAAFPDPFRFAKSRRIAAEDSRAYASTISQKRPTLHLKPRAVIQTKTHPGSPAANSGSPGPHRTPNPNEEAVRAEIECLCSRWPQAIRG